MHDEAQLVDEVRAEQRLYEPGAAVGDEVSGVCGALQCRNLRCEVARRGVGSPPFGAGRRAQLAIQDAIDGRPSRRRVIKTKT